MIGFAAQRLMELEVEGQTGAACGEKNPDCLAQRNGYRGRSATMLSVASPVNPRTVRSADQSI